MRHPWDVEKAAFTEERYDGAATRLAWSPGGTMLGAASAEGSIHFWSAGKRTSLPTGQGKPCRQSVLQRGQLRPRLGLFGRPVFSF